MTRPAESTAQESFHEAPRRGPRVALLTPYTGGNLGDAAIQDAVIANLRQRLPFAQFSGISLNSDNFRDRHGTDGYPLCASFLPFYRTYTGKITAHPESGESGAKRLGPAHRTKAWIKSALKRVRPIWLLLKSLKTLKVELRHCSGGYRFIRRHDLLIVSGGGQLDEEWGGPWGHPYALFKWGLLARLARVPYAIASVGAGKTACTTSRLFLSGAMRMASYRSYRDENTKKIAAGMFRPATADFVVPDMAFSLAPSVCPLLTDIRSRAGDRFVIGISTIAFAKPGIGPYENNALYDRYLDEMAKVVSRLLEADQFVIFVWSSMGDDQGVVPEVLERLDTEARSRATAQTHIPAISTWRDLVAVLQGVDALIASRLHSTILGLVVGRPTIAISFDPKVDWVMEDVGQTAHLLHIYDFTSAAVVESLERARERSEAITEQIYKYKQMASKPLSAQYDVLTKVATASFCRRVQRTERECRTAR